MFDLSTILFFLKQSKRAINIRITTSAYGISIIAADDAHKVRFSKEIEWEQIEELMQ